MILPVNPQSQEDSVWCWVAVASMVSQYFSQQGVGPALTQCQVASATLGRPCCPSPPPPPSCHFQMNLKTALLICGHLNNVAQPSNSFGIVVSELNAGRPLCAAFQYINGPLHYLLITGYDAASQQIALIDPATGVLTYGPYANFLSNNSGAWAGWVFTR
jgi:hypothetical protein